MSAITTPPSVATVQRLDFCEHFGRRGSKTLVSALTGADTRSRCQAFSSVSRPRNLEGPLPGPGIGRIGSSPALRTARPSRIDSEGLSLALPMGVCEGRFRGARCTSPGIPNQGTAPLTTEVYGALHQEPNPRHGIPSHRSARWRFTRNPTHGMASHPIEVQGGASHGIPFHGAASLPQGPESRRWQPDPGRQSRNPFSRQPLNSRQSH